MNTTRGREIALGTVLALATFMLPMAACLGLLGLNARLTPATAWFPLPVLAVCVATAVFAQRRWRIGLTHPPGVPWGRVYLLALTTTVVGVCVAILQGAAVHLVRAAEFGPAGTGDSFRVAFAFVMPVVSAILAEVAFRGVMQGRLQAVMAPWAAILLVTAVNTASHRWTAETAAQWIGYSVLLAGCGYVRWLGRSVLPALAAHVAQNIALAWVLYRYGPFVLGEMSGAALAATAALGAAALGLTWAVGRTLHGRARPAH